MIKINNKIIKAFNNLNNLKIKLNKVTSSEKYIKYINKKIDIKYVKSNKYQLNNLSRCEYMAFLHRYIISNKNTYDKDFIIPDDNDFKMLKSLFNTKDSNFTNLMFELKILYVENVFQARLLMEELIKEDSSIYEYHIKNNKKLNRVYLNHNKPTHTICKCGSIIKNNRISRNSHKRTKKHRKYVIINQ